MPFDPSKHHRQSIRWRDHDYSSPGSYFITLCVANRECLFGDIEDGVVRLSDAGRVVWEEWNNAIDAYANARTDPAVVMPNHFHAIVTFAGSVGAIHELPLPSEPDANVGAIHELPLPSEPDANVRAIHELPLPSEPDANARAIHELPLPMDPGADVGALHALPRPTDVYARGWRRRRMGLGLLVGRFKMRSAKRINALRGVEGVVVWQRNYYEHVIRDEQEWEHCCEYIVNNPGRWSEDHEHPLHRQADTDQPKLR